MASAASLGCSPHAWGALPWPGPPRSLPSDPPIPGGGQRSTPALHKAQGVLNRGNSISSSYTQIMFLLKKKKSMYRLTLFSSWPQHSSEWGSWREPAADMVSSAGCPPSVASLTEVRFQ